MTHAIAGVSRETSQRLQLLKTIVLEESANQNLISLSTITTIDERHIADSLQLLSYLPDGAVLDIGSGGGFPGLVLACAGEHRIHLVEPRTKRAAFLVRAVAQLGLGQRVHVHASRVERVSMSQLGSITARAVASLTRIFEMAAHLADEKTRWVLPKGQSAASELEEAQRTWQGSFRLVPSMTDADAAIVIAEGVRRRPAR